VFFKHLGKIRPAGSRLTRRGRFAARQRRRRFQLGQHQVNLSRIDGS
jgi:hypothetical protein